MDTHAARLANLLVGNLESDALLETTLAGPTLGFASDVTCAIVGADMDPRMDGEPVASLRAFRARAGTTLALGIARTGCRAYLAFGGGIAVPEILGSRSTYLPAGFGGLHGRALRAGDALALGDAKPGNEVSRPPRALGTGLTPRIGGRLRFVAGEHLPSLTAAARRTLFEAEYRVSVQSDRMGYRLEGPVLDGRPAGELLSSAVTMGTMQLPANGLPILLMADRQTTGGYPRLGQVATVDLGAAAQLRPGDIARFEEISLDDAQRLYLERERALGALRRALSYPP